MNRSWPFFMYDPGQSLRRYYLPPIPHFPAGAGAGRTRTGQPPLSHLRPERSRRLQLPTVQAADLRLGLPFSILRASCKAHIPIWRSRLRYWTASLR